MSIYELEMKQLLVILCAVLGTALSAGLQCKDEEGNNVDWYVVYKIPEGCSSQSGITSGKEYMFITSNTVEKRWTFSKKTMAENTNIISRTIENMYQKSDKELWLVYNDQGPARTRSKTINAIREIIDLLWNKHGHTKGVVGANSEGGFWLVHSIPRFPTLDSYNYPHNALRNGQSALCISLSAEELDKIGNAFKYNFPDFVRSQYSDELGAKFPTLKEAAEGGKTSNAPWNNSFAITSKGGVQFETFAKGKSFGKDLYEWLASALETDMYAETWQNELHPLSASCSISKKVMNVHKISYKPANLYFKSRKDHSKWAISASHEKPYVCIGDINRALPQEKRGGGTVCIRNEGLWKAYNDIIDEKDSC
uniref:Deoxyribonuclease-2-alpha n=1 Tax=Lygus hesperus TaxID=30085 RepID=A0A0A9Y189_LYGHE